MLLNSKRRLTGLGRNVLLCALGLAVIAVVLAVCTKVITQQAESSFEQFMNEVAEAESDNVYAVIEDKFSVLHGISALITADTITDEENLLERFHEVVDSGAFSRVGLIYPDGQGIGYDSELGILPVDNYANRAYVQAALQGSDAMSEPMYDKYTDKEGVVFAVPIFNLKHEGSEPIGVLAGITSVEAFTKSIDVSLFEGQGYVHIIDSSGTILFRSSRGLAGAYENILSPDFQQTRPLADIQADLSSGTGGAVGFTRADGTPMISLYRPIGVNDWFIDIVVPADYLEAKNRTILLSVVGLAMFVILVVVLLMAAIVHTQRRSQHALDQAALTDTLTGIDNELAFMRKSKARPEYFDEKHYLVLFNLVGFSLFNTIFGYPKGSELIQQVARILSSSIKKDELVARLSGDRFVLLLEGRDPIGGEQKLLEAMDAIDAAIQPHDTQYRIASQCCVYCLRPEDATRDVNLIVQDMAVPLKQAKDHAGMRIVRFDKHYVAKANRVRHIEAIMTSALSQEEFIAYFQPQYDICKGAVLCGAEALVRWRSPVLGFVTPAEFIPIFEKNGSIAKIDEYMLERTCIRLREWLDGGLACVPVSVNLSRRNLFSSDLISRIKQLVDAYGIPYELIKFELTESIVSENEAQLVQAVHELRAHGFQVSLDDFGTGYSAFSAITDVAFDSVKLDRSFFGKSLETDHGRKAAIGVIKLLDQLDFETVAEGIETEAEVALLRTWGCKVVQGYVFGKPLPAEEFMCDHLQPAQEHLSSRRI